ncbi:MAG: hypothetical protein WCB93_08840 [Gallionella sp.]
MSPDQSGAAHENAGNKNRMQDKRNGANRVLGGNGLNALKFISGTGIEFSRNYILLMLRVLQTARSFLFFRRLAAL